MILVTKPAQAPAALGPGVAATTANRIGYDADPAAYRAGTTKFRFDGGIYGAPAVKAALKQAQFGKCCFCEAVFDANYAGDVEHYRPKGAVGAGRQLIWPGYYWLAYAWENLFYACADCNQYRKRAAFPLANEANRALDHHCDCSAEEPLILCPGGPPDPRDHIDFNRDVPRGTSAPGRTTITRLKLDREALCASRRKHFRLLEALLEIVRLGRGSVEPDRIQSVENARAALRGCMAADAEFSAASRDFLIPIRAQWDDNPP